MKALTLTQPWASLVALGEKYVETRSWSTTYRGPLAIHAAKGFPHVAKDLLLFDRRFQRVLRRHGVWFPEELPLGVVLAIARLDDILPIDEALERRVKSDQERAFGDYSPGRFAWFLTDIRLLPEPVPARGALGLWEWTLPAGALP